MMIGDPTHPWVDWKRITRRLQSPSIGVVYLVKTEQKSIKKIKEKRGESYYVRSRASKSG